MAGAEGGDVVVALGVGGVPAGDQRVADLRDVGDLQPTCRGLCDRQVGVRADLCQVGVAQETGQPAAILAVDAPLGQQVEEAAAYRVRPSLVHGA